MGESDNSEDPPSVITNKLNWKVGAVTCYDKERSSALPPGTAKIFPSDPIFELSDTALQVSGFAQTFADTSAFVTTPDQPCEARVSTRPSSTAAASRAT